MPFPKFAARLENLMLAWQWIRSNPDRAYKSHFRELMALGEAGQPCRDRWEQLGTVHVGLLDVGELPTKRRELRA